MGTVNKNKLLLAAAMLFLLFQSKNILAQTEPSLLSPLSSHDAYKAIIKIKPFSLDEDFNLEYTSYGSGVIISSSGLILTNNHVVDIINGFDNSDTVTAYQVCLPDNTTDEPDCSYIGKLISKNKDLDIALLQIENIPGLSDKTNYPFLDLNLSDMVNSNDEVTAIGYPAIGGSSITVTRGIVSGKVEKYGKKWIKTDAVISFGNSGGAAIDKDNKIIGITSASHSDLLGSLGYIINISSVNQWINDNKSKQAKPSVLDNRVISFTKKEKEIKNSNIFKNNIPEFFITKPEGWTFKYTAEDMFSTLNPGDEDGGVVLVQKKKYPFIIYTNDIVPRLKLSSLVKGDLSFLIRKEENVKIGGLPAKKMYVVNSAGSLNFYAISFKNEFISIVYYYGKDDKDKSVVDGIINSFQIKNINVNFSETKKYSHDDPKFSLAVEGDWALQRKNSKADPLRILNKKHKDIYVQVTITKTNENTKKLNNEGWIKIYKDAINSLNKVGAIIDYKFVINETNAHYNVNKNFKDAIKIVVAIKTPSDGKTVAYKISYSKKIGDKYFIDIVFVTTNPDKKIFNNYQKELNKMLQNFAIPGSDFSKVDSDNDGLTDQQEIPYGTDLNNPDTDGDGFKDGGEVKNGYNPMGSGKLEQIQLTVEAPIVSNNQAKPEAPKVTYDQACGGVNEYFIPECARTVAIYNNDISICEKISLASGDDANPERANFKQSCLEVIKTGTVVDKEMLTDGQMINERYFSSAALDKCKLTCKQAKKNYSPPDKGVGSGKQSFNAFAGVAPDKNGSIYLATCSCF